VPPVTSSDHRVCLGVIVGAKGLKGEVRIKSFTAEPADVAAYGPVESEDGKASWALDVVGEAKGAVIVRLKGVTDRNQADALRGMKLYVHRSKLPPAVEGTYYHTDLVGMNVVLTTGETKGQVVAVLNFGGGDIIEIGDGKNETTMVPFSSEAIAEVNVSERLISVEPLPGLFDSGDADDEEGDDQDRNDAAPVTRHG
jgi:16S rRNA processing protein RimM